MMKKLLITLMATCFVGGAVAQDEAKSKDFAKLLKGQLIAVDGDKTKAAEFEGGKEYYLFYHSASW